MRSGRSFVLSPLVPQYQTFRGPDRIAASCQSETLWRGQQQPSPAMPSDQVARSMSQVSFPNDEGSCARQDNADLGVLADNDILHCNDERSIR
jgi:hypothetical protein